MTRIEMGERIREIRLMRNMTRDQLSTESGLSSKFLYEVENGKKGLSVESLLKIAEALSCSCDQIIMGKEVDGLIINQEKSLINKSASQNKKDV